MKPLIFVKTQIKVDRIPEPVESWELVSFGPCPVMHAAWNPVAQMLVCQLDSVKENFVDFPVKDKKGGVNHQERRADQYYRVTLSDKDAVKYILENLTANYTDQEWEIRVDPELIAAEQII